MFHNREPTEPSPRRSADYKIEHLLGTTPLVEQLYGLSEKELLVRGEYIQIYLKRGWIRALSSPAGALILFVKKKDGSLRLPVHYRGLNAVSVKDQYSLPLINTALDRLRSAKVYTSLDIREGYHHIWITEGDKWKTAFRTWFGLYEYTVMPSGLTNAPATFQQ